MLYPDELRDRHKDIFARLTNYLQAFFTFHNPP